MLYFVVLDDFTPANGRDGRAVIVWLWGLIPNSNATITPTKRSQITIRKMELKQSDPHIYHRGISDALLAGPSLRPSQPVRRKNRMNSVSWENLLGNNNHRRKGATAGQLRER